MHKNFTATFRVLCAFAFFFTGCASTWAPVSESSPEPLQWLDSSNRARATYLETIRGFKETGTTIPNMLKTIVFGNRASDNTIKQPVAAAVGLDNRIAIADLGCSCIHLYVPSEQRYRKIHSAGKEELKTPVSVAFDDEYKVYVSDSTRNAIYVFDREGNFSFSIKRAGNVPFGRPTGLWYAPGKKTLYAVDTLAKKIYAFNKAGDVLFSFGEPGERQTQFNFPTHITGDSRGRVYVTDAMNFRVQVFDAAGKFLSTFGHHGNGSGDLARPKGIAVDKLGVIYIVDTLFDNIQLFNLSGSFLFTIGRRGDRPGEFSMPSGLFLDSRGKLYVCDTYNQKVQIFQLTEYQE